MTQAAGVVADRPYDGLARAIQTGRIGAFEASSDFATCLMPLLSALGWRGDPRFVAEALPHFADSLDLVDLRNVLANLNFGSRSFDLTLSRLDPRLAPCLFVPDKGNAIVVLSVDEDGIDIFDGSRGESETISGKGVRGKVYVLTPLDEETSQAPRNRMNWFRTSPGNVPADVEKVR